MPFTDSFPAMPRRSSHFLATSPGFTLLEICLVLMIAFVILAVAIPSLSSALSSSRSKSSFSEFDDMVQDAHGRAIAERRAYVLIWSPKKVVMRPDEPANKAEADGLRQIEIAKDDVLNLFLPASLALKQGKLTVAIWTFWPNGACEPAPIEYKGKLGKWSATYNPFTVQADPNYD